MARTPLHRQTTRWPGASPGGTAADFKRIPKRRLPGIQTQCMNMRTRPPFAPEYSAKRARIGMRAQPPPPGRAACFRNPGAAGGKNKLLDPWRQKVSPRDRRENLDLVKMRGLNGRRALWTQPVRSAALTCPRRWRLLFCLSFFLQPLCRVCGAIDRQCRLSLCEILASLQCSGTVLCLCMYRGPAWFVPILAKMNAFATVPVMEGASMTLQSRTLARD